MRDPSADRPQTFAEAMEQLRQQWREFIDLLADEGDRLLDRLLAGLDRWARRP